VDFRLTNGFRLAISGVCNAQIWLVDGMKGLVNAPMFQLPSGGQDSDISVGKSILCSGPFRYCRLVARAESRRCHRCQTFENHCEIGH